MSVNLIEAIQSHSLLSVRISADESIFFLLNLFNVTWITQYIKEWKHETMWYLLLNNYLSEQQEPTFLWRTIT